MTGPQPHPSLEEQIFWAHVQRGKEDVDQQVRAKDWKRSSLEQQAWTWCSFRQWKHASSGSSDAGISAMPHGQGCDQVSDPSVIQTNDVKGIALRVEEENKTSTPEAETEDEPGVANLIDHDQFQAELGAHPSLDQLQGLNPHTAHKLGEQARLRTNGPSIIMLLLFTDQVGPNVVPYAEAGLGYVPTNILFVCLGFAAVMCGSILLHVFCSLDSVRYPVSSYPDLVQRIAGPWARWGVVLLQQSQLILLIGLATLTNAGALESLLEAHNKTMCFTLAVAVWAIVGIFFAQVRTIRGLGSLSYLALCVNIALVVISMVVMKRDGLNWRTIRTNQNLGDPPYPPIQTAAFVHASLASRVNSVFNIIYCYGGALIFIEVASEMRNPRLFWRGLASTEVALLALYILYANWTYNLSGQYALSPAYQGMAAGKALDAANVLYLLTGILYAAIVGNAVLKGVYSEVIEGVFHGPPRTSSLGIILWIPFTVLIWGVSYAVASAIPQVGTIQGLVSALAVFNFSFTFPPLLALVLYIQRERKGLATYRDYTFPIVGQVRPWTVKGFLLALGLACSAMSILGIWGAVVSIKSVFSQGGATGTSFGCASTY